MDEEKDVSEDTKSNEAEAVSDTKEVIVKKKTGFFLEKLELEIKNGYRITEYNGVKYKIYMPSISDDVLISEHKAQVTNKCLKNKDLMLRDEVLNNLRERGVWNNEKEKQERKIRDEISKCYAEMMVEKAKDDPDPDFILSRVKERVSLEIDLAILSESKNALLQSTIENKIEEELLKFKLVLLVKTENDEKVWPTVDDFINFADKAFSNTIATEAIYFWAGLDQSMFGLAPDQ